MVVAAAQQPHSQAKPLAQRAKDAAVDEYVSAHQAATALQQQGKQKAAAARGGPLQSALRAIVEFWLNALRVCALLLITPLLIPALLLRCLGGGAVSLLLTFALIPFSLGYWVFKTGIKTTRGVVTTLLSLPATVVMMPYRFFILLTKPHSMEGQYWSKNAGQ